MKLIALDVGTKRIGVAKADSKVRIAIPYSAVEVNGEELKKIASLARAWDIKNFVLGLPRNSEGQETKQSLYVRKFAKDLKRAIPEAKICFQDESLTSVEAENRLKNRKKGYKKGDIDSEAATIILQDFLEEKTGKTTSRAAAARSKSVKGAKPHGLLHATIIVLVLLAVAAGGALVYYNYSLRAMGGDVDCAVNPANEACNSTIFSVREGATAKEVAGQLETAGLVRNSFVFQIYLRLNSDGNSIKAGEYDFNKAMPVAEIAEVLLHGGESTYTFTIFPGDNVFEVRSDLIELGYSEEEVDAALSKDYRKEKFGWIFEGMPEDSKSLEGYLWPETYAFYRSDKVEKIIRTVLEQAAKEIEAESYKQKFADRGFNLYQGITLASVIQQEANNFEDMAKVAKIFYNRLDRNMLLGSDVTAKYAADLVDPDRTTYTDNAKVIDIDSPYNTRKHPGLPYGPVSNPGTDALNAVATPNDEMADTLFFLTGDDSLMYYSNTEEGHLKNISDHCQVLCAVAL